MVLETDQIQFFRTGVTLLSSGISHLFSKHDSLVRSTMMAFLPLILTQTTATLNLVRHRSAQPLSNSKSSALLNTGAWQMVFYSCISTNAWGYYVLCSAFWSALLISSCLSKYDKTLTTRWCFTLDRCGRKVTSAGVQSTVSVWSRLNTRKPDRKSSIHAVTWTAESDCVRLNKEMSRY